MDEFADMTLEALSSLAAEKRSALSALFALDAPTLEQVGEAESLAAEVEKIETEVKARETAATEAAEKFAALKDKFGTVEGESGNVDHGTSPAEAGTGDPEEHDAPAEVEGDPAEVEKEADEAAKSTGGAPKSTARSQTVVTLARKTQRPAAPARNEGLVAITAAADSGFPVGSKLDGLAQMTEAVINRMKGFTPPTGDGRSENLQKFGVASITRPFSKELTVDRGSDDMEVLNYAAQEARLPGDSLVAAGGWCAPSETMYDLCPGEETLEGLISIPEINVKRGGINYTRGPDFADFYGVADGRFVQTETQAIAGATKPCVTVDCPDFTEVRLDAQGLCIKIPILTNVGYPEVVQRYVSGFLTAYQHRVSADVISRMLALTPAARVYSGIGSSVEDSLDALIIIADQRRQQRRMSMNRSFEVVLPFWTKNMFKSDLRKRTGQMNPVTDQQLSAFFAAANLNVQYVYNWQALASNTIAYPATYNALMYPAGTFVKGTQDVINLSAVYDAASLAENVYTGLFMEEGILVAKMCNDSDLVTLPVCNAGRTGAADFTCA